MGILKEKPEENHDYTFIIISCLILLFVPLLLAIYYHFREFDGRKINPKQPIQIGDQFFGGRVRISIPNYPSLDATSISEQTLGNRKIQTRRMVTLDYSFVYKDANADYLVVHSFYKNSEINTPYEEDLKLSLEDNIAYLTIPQAASLERWKGKKLILHLDHGKLWAQSS